MSGPSSLLSVGTRFELNKRIGAVIEQRRNSVIVLWEEFVDPQTGEVFAPIAESLEAPVISDADLRGALRILYRPSVGGEKSGRPLFLRSDKEVARQKWRLCHVQAATLLIEQGLLKPTRASFVQNALLLLSKGDQIYREMLLRKAQGEKKRGGATITIGQQQRPPRSAAQVHKWYLSFKREGPAGLFDRYSRSGNRSDRYDPAIMAIVRSVINTRLDEERCTVASIVDSVQAACLLHYERHGRRGSLKMPGYEFVHDLIDALAPIEHQIRRRGFAVAYKDMHSLGVGITTSRAFERVEIDEHSLDLMVILQGFGIWDWLTAEEREQLNLNGTASRVTISAAIDVHTRCIVAMRMSAGSTTTLARDTIEMLVQDKTPVADALGAHDPWDMYGRPEKIVFDRGPTYLTDELYDLLAELGIGYLGAPARKPWLRPFIERLFRTVHNGLVQRFSGRTFSDVVAKGENDAQDVRRRMIWNRRADFVADGLGSSGSGYAA
ncbi:DDE-type integrase/transposase/recombinase [Pseudogemmobacter faecipullorum]|uniref:Transposase family protein n=1 Tax=Pseudogemmobacter faecipullorum TaxID=2755041 RepID=A0ABS8CS84_9RHOB|nr:DDE-type integrase/transposase/recombinase [Pseudogemmobacter faecipullorum]MCB5412261.1 transposase family protein [Pseudogemmobacter faecipullorum]